VVETASASDVVVDDESWSELEQLASRAAQSSAATNPVLRRPCVAGTK
jgi:hypothetical protein